MLTCSLFFLFNGVIAGAQAELRVVDASSSTAFEWDQVPNADRYLVQVGTTPGARDVARRGSTGNSAVVQQLPVDGSTLYATLRARVNGRWTVDSTLEFDASNSPMIQRPFINSGSPALNGSIARFSWSNVSESPVTNVVLMAGTANKKAAYSRRRAVEGDNFVTLDKLPLDGSTIFVTLMWRDSQGRLRIEQPVEYKASQEPLLRLPAEGSTLTGSSAKLLLGKLDGNVAGANIRWRVKAGTTNSPVAYKIWNPTGYASAIISGLPTDGSNIAITPQYFDGRRWIHAKTIQYTAASAPSDYLWGDCSTPEFGRKLPRSTMFGDYDNKTYRLLSDSCASDRDYAVEPAFGINLKGGTPTEHVKGLFVWLAADSGAGKVTVLTSDNESTTRAAKPALRVIHSSNGNSTPVYIPLSSKTAATDGHPDNIYQKISAYLEFDSLDQAKPVKISEIRLARAGDNIEDLRKTGLAENSQSTSIYTDSHNGGFNSHFAAMTGDARASVTAEIASQYSPNFDDYQAWTYTPNVETCGLYRWIDATGEIDAGIQIDNDSEFSQKHGTTVWVNWDLATNAQVIAAINQSVEAGRNYPLASYLCSTDTQVDQSMDWTGKASAALQGSSKGPTVNFNW